MRDQTGQGLHAVNKHGMLGFRLAESCQATLLTRVFWQSLKKKRVALQAPCSFCLQALSG